MATGTAVATPKLAEGDEYSVDAVMPAMPDDDQLAEVEFGVVAQPKQSNVPEELAALAAETVAEAESPIEQVRALETFLAEGGFFSHGLEGEVLSRAGHTSERITTLIGGDQMIGDDEQYAVAMALLAGELGIPVRVVMGYYPEEEQAGEAVFAATGDDVHAWVEVNFDGVGLAAVRPDSAGGSGPQRPEHEAEDRPQAPGPAASAPAAGAGRPAADAAR